MTAVPPLVDDSHLIASGGLSGQPLFDRAGDKLGIIKEFYLNRVTGQVEFVLGATGGFLGVGEKFHPLPWALLRYNAAPEGYVVLANKNDIRDAPAYDRDQLNSARYGWGGQVHRYFAGLNQTADRV